MREQQTSNKRIAKNTIYLYLRLGFSMIIALFTSRVILQVLGITDMGIQSSVGGVVTFATFLNGALSNGSSRFLTYALGEGDLEKTRNTFSTVFWVHAGLAVIIIIVTEIVGLYFLYNKLVIPEYRMDAAVWVFHLSILSMAVGMTQVPYSATVVAHEKMTMFAYTGIIDVINKLIIVYLLTIVPGDKLKWYSTLFFVVHTGMALFYRWYCIHNFEETRLKFYFNRDIFKPIAQYSGWQLFAKGVIALNSQGIVIMLNMFFSPAIVAARSISLQVNGVASQFMNNFRSAATPQIIKSYAAGEYETSKRLLLQTTVLSFYLMWMMSLPICLLADKLLYVWLGQVPEYSTIFLQLVVIQSLFQIFDTGFYTAISAKGRLRENALTSPVLGFVVFFIIYILFRNGAGPIAQSWMFIIFYAILGLIFKPIILIHIVGGYQWRDFFLVFRQCLLVTAASLPIPLLFHFYISPIINNVYVTFIAEGFVCVLTIAIVVWFLGIDKEMKHKLITFVTQKLHRHK